MHWHEEHEKHEKPVQRSMSHDGQCRGEVENQHFDCSGYGKSSSTFHCMVIRIGFLKENMSEKDEVEKLRIRFFRGNFFLENRREKKMK